MTRLIDAEPLEEVFEKQANERLCGYSEFMEGVKNGYRLALMHIKNAPTVEERKHGEWVDNHNGTFTCTECGEKHSKSNFCPNCGADMRKEKVVKRNEM